MSLVNKSIAVGNRMTLLGRSVNMSARICLSTDSRNPYGGYYDGNYSNNMSFGSMNYNNMSNPILNTYENNLGGVDTRNKYPKVDEWDEQFIIKTYRSTFRGKENYFNTNKDKCNIKEQQQSFGGKYEGYVQFNTYDGNYYGTEHSNMHRDTYYGRVQMSTYRSSKDGNEKNTQTYGNFDGDKRNDKCGGNKDGKESEILGNFAPICLACAGGPCPSRPTKYDSRKFKRNLPKNDIATNFEGVPNVPSGVFRHTEGECLGRNNAAKCTCYQNPEYFSFHNMTFFDMHLVMRPMRRPCPKSGRKP